MLSLLSHVQFIVTSWTIDHQAPLSLGFSRQEYWSGLPWSPPGELLNPGIENVPPQFSCSVMYDSLRPYGLEHARLPSPSPTPGAGDVIQPSHPLLSPSPPTSIFASIRVFSNESVLCIRWPKYWSFSFSISPSNEYSGLISFRIDFFDLLVVQGTLKSLLQHHTSKASIVRLSAFYMVQLSYLYMTTGKTIALTRWTFAGKVMPLILNMLSRLLIAFLPRSKCLLISWLSKHLQWFWSPRK